MSPPILEVGLKALGTEVISRQVVSPEPAAQVGHQSNLTAGALPTITLFVQKCRVGIDVGAQRTFVQSLKCFGVCQKLVGHVFSFWKLR